MLRIRQLRDYIYIDDLVPAMLLAGERKDADNRIFNVGSGTGVQFAEAANMIIKLAKCGDVRHVKWPGPVSKTETGDFVADVGLIEESLGWKPTVSMASGLESVITFYRKRTKR